jgi:hypothetical protein
MRRRYLWYYSRVEDVVHEEFLGSAISRGSIDLFSGWVNRGE